MKRRPSDEELMRYMRSPAFRRRAKRTQAKIIAGEKLSFDEMSRLLKLPVDVLIGGFEHSMAKHGMPVKAVGRLN